MFENINDIDILRTSSLLIKLYHCYAKNHGTSEEYEKAVSIAIMALNQITQDNDFRGKVI